MERMREGMKGIKSQLSKESEIAQAILTIDKAKKEIAVRIDKFTIGAIAKGSGMIHPNMATMLSFITTDAEISSKALRAFLKHSADLSFNMISVDRDTSTSDMAVILANGLAGKVDAKKFQQGLDFVCMYLAKEIAKDGEGSTRLIKVNVKNAVTENDARKVAKAIISSNLVKCAVFGNDPNWGRILCAIGNSGAHFTEGKIDVYFDEHKLVGDGMAKGFDKATVKEIMKNDELLVTIDLKEGKHEATAYGCDMSLEYVKLSAQYKT
jgi:glutamate N-acetyltransferase/amino-acid N-acetyltransferase